MDIDSDKGGSVSRVGGVADNHRPALDVGSRLKQPRIMPRLGKIDACFKVSRVESFEG